eukprot:gene25530-33003_t
MQIPWPKSIKDPALHLYDDFQHSGGQWNIGPLGAEKVLGAGQLA